MPKFYIEYANGVFGNTGIDMDNLSDADFKLRGWLRLQPSASPMIDNNKTSAFVYEIKDDVVYMNWSVSNKVGADLQAAIENKWHEVRANRRLCLKESDYTQMADAPIATEMRVKWAVYRQKLRDITKQPDPFSLVWPSTPDGKETFIRNQVLYD